MLKFQPAALNEHHSSETPVLHTHNCRKTADTTFALKYRILFAGGCCVCLFLCFLALDSATEPLRPQSSTKVGLPQLMHPQTRVLSPSMDSRILALNSRLLRCCRLATPWTAERIPVLLDQAVLPLCSSQLLSTWRGSWRGCGCRHPNHGQNGD